MKFTCTCATRVYSHYVLVIYNNYGLLKARFTFGAKTECNIDAEVNSSRLQLIWLPTQLMKCMVFCVKCRPQALVVHINYYECYIAIIAMGLT